METEKARLVEELIAKLKVNDRKPASEFEETPKEPREAMEELVRIGRPATEPLLELLKNASKYSCFYAIKVLGDIGDPSAAQPILNMFSNQEYLDTFAEIGDEYLEAALALHKIGLPSLEPTLTFLKERIKQDDDLGIYHATRILVGIKNEKSFAALVNLMSQSDDQPQLDAVAALGDYGDKRAVEHLKKLLPNAEIRNEVLESIRKLLPTQDYWEIIAPYAVEQLKSLHEGISQNLRDLQYAHEYADKPSPRFEGDNARELNALALERRIREAVENLLQKAIEVGVYEAIIPDDTGYEFNRMLLRAQEKWLKFKSDHEEEMNIVEGRIPIISEMTKSYKGLAQTSWGPNPKLDDLRMKILEWLKKQDFLVTREHSHLWARQGKKASRKCCYVAVVKDDERPRSWGAVNLTLWGKAWTSNEAETFQKAFWTYVEKIVTELVGKKKLQTQIIKE